MFYFGLFICNIICLLDFFSSACYLTNPMIFFSFKAELFNKLLCDGFWNEMLFHINSISKDKIQMILFLIIYFTELYRRTKEFEDLYSWKNQSIESTESRALVGCFHAEVIRFIFCWEWQNSFRTKLFFAKVHWFYSSAMQYI